MPTLSLQLSPSPTGSLEEAMRSATAALTGRRPSGQSAQWSSERSPRAPTTIFPSLSSMWRAAICLPIPSFEPTRVRTRRPTHFAGWERPKARERAPPPGSRGRGDADASERRRLAQGPRRSGRSPPAKECELADRFRPAPFPSEPRCRCRSRESPPRSPFAAVQRRWVAARQLQPSVELAHEKRYRGSVEFGRWSGEASARTTAYLNRGSRCTRCLERRVRPGIGRGLRRGTRGREGVPAHRSRDGRPATSLCRRVDGKGQSAGGVDAVQ
jgi:hypothetical protein